MQLIDDIHTELFYILKLEIRSLLYMLETCVNFVTVYVKYLISIVLVVVYVKSKFSVLFSSNLFDNS